MSDRKPLPAQSDVLGTAVTVAWDRGEAGLTSIHNIVERYSVQHVALDGGNHALCGARIPWSYVCAGDSRRCKRCFRIAAGKGYADEYGHRYEDGP